jgi:hypothetical protein
MSFPRMLPFKFSTGDNRAKPLRDNARVTVSRLLTEPCSVHYANLRAHEPMGLIGKHSVEKEGEVWE